MKDFDLLIVAVLLVLVAEVTYLVAKLPRQSHSKTRYIFVDTSVLIDGRIVAVATSGFIGDTLAIPRSVIGELQFLADNADADKRARARHGLDVANELQKLESVDVVLFQDGSKAEEGVDERLLNLAKKHGGAICTIDYNLNKVAVVEGIRVCNVNELAKNLRMAYLPGEKIMLELTQKGQDQHQAVGHLPDGTMVVVENASSVVGKTVEIEFIRSLQTAAGKMMFAKRTDSKNQQPKKSVPQLPQKQHAKQQSAGRKQAQTSTQPQSKPQAQSQQSQSSNRPARARRVAKSGKKGTEDSLIALVEKQSNNQ